MEQPNEYPTKQSQTGNLRGSSSTDQRETQRGSEEGTQVGSGEAWNISERVSREAGPWASLALFTIGGIIGQLIQDLEYQLAYQQSSIDWYKAEIKKNQEALSWHEDKLQDVERRLESLKAHANSLKQSLSE